MKPDAFSQISEASSATVAQLEPHRRAKQTARWINPGVEVDRFEINRGGTHACSTASCANALIGNACNEIEGLT